VTSFAGRKAQLTAAFEAGGNAPFALDKDTSNLFRDRQALTRRRLDVRAFCHVLEVDARSGWVDVEGMTPYDILTEATLQHGVMPAVVPQLKSITIGGAAAGVGIEASSFRFGLVHDTLLEIEVLTGTGDVVIAKPDNEHSDLFFGFPNSYGTLGYALRLKARTAPVKRYVHLSHRPHSDPATYFREITALMKTDIDFLDGTVFSPGEMVITVGRFVDEAPWVSDYSFEHIYYRSIRERRDDYLSTSDFIWRWDTDWFWCSKNLGAQSLLVRRLLGRKRLNSRFYTKVMRWNSRVGLTRFLDRMSGLHRESVIQDVDIPIERAPEFLEFFHREIGLLPVWVCPIHARQPTGHFGLYPVEPGRVLINFGFWDVVRRRESFSAGHHNRLIERKVQELGGIKSLYSDSYFPEDEFWRNYGGDAYRRLKARYDPQGVLGDLYKKAVLRES
jgi:FAD/FMN-containing dehydrogenase